MGEWREVLSALMFPLLAGAAVDFGWYGTATAAGLLSFYTMFSPIEKHLAEIARNTERPQ